MLGFIGKAAQIRYLRAMIAAQAREAEALQEALRVARRERDEARLRIVAMTEMREQGDKAA